MGDPGRHQLLLPLAAPWATVFTPFTLGLIGTSGLMPLWKCPISIRSQRLCPVQWQPSHPVPFRLQNRSQDAAQVSAENEFFG